jgi:predicted aldo/keto reductase-like oxidoreductase
MQYRTFGKLDWKVSALGFGMMRLPMTDKTTEAIDEPEALRMMRWAIDQGVNYLDTAYLYHGSESEPFLGKVLKEGYREKVRIATKLPCWKVEKAEDFDRFFNEQLERVQVEKFDFYLLHALNRRHWENVRKLGVLDWLQGKKADGKVGQIGFSFHDGYEVFQGIIDGFAGWDFCQIQYNYMDVDNQAGHRGLKYAADKGLGVVIMEPLLGGKLVEPPRSVLEVFHEANPAWTPVEWALQWLWDQPEVSLVLSGMSAMAQVEQNVAIASRSDAGSLGEAGRATMVRARQAFEGIVPIPCTQCGYCMPCPNGVDIPNNFRIFNRAAMLGDWEEAQYLYEKHFTVESCASACLDCGECEEKCPQQIAISDWMPYVDRVLSKKEAYDGRTSPSK